MLARVCCLLAVLTVLPAHAQWSGNAALGYLASTGNSRTKSLNGKLNLGYDAGQWQNSFEALGVTSSEDGQTTSERYAASDKVDWTITGRNYVFAALDWEHDRFGGIRTRTSETVGLGRHVLVGPVHTLDVEAGAGARQSEANVTHEKEDDVIFRGRAKYQWKISPTSTFGQALKVESGSSNTYAESTTELKLSIVGDLFLALGYTVKHNTDVPADTVHTDTFTSVNLSYNFGKS